MEVTSMLFYALKSVSMCQGTEGRPLVWRGCKSHLMVVYVEKTELNNCNCNSALSDIDMYSVATSQ